MILHIYFNASDDPAAYDADQIDRQAVTAEFAWEYLCDQPLWLWSDYLSSQGRDPWIQIGGMDKMTHATPDRVYILETGRTGERIVPADYRLFTLRQNLRRLGLPQGEPGGPKTAVVSCS